jgi:endoribonuclease Dicer
LIKFWLTLAGSGKTLIAVLLLRHIFNQELEDRAMGKLKRISFFLVSMFFLFLRIVANAIQVDSVTLVFQQHAVLKANLDQPMDMFCGDMKTDLWSQKTWQKHFEKNMVIVCTAEVLRQCLHKSYISIERINLLIFDEAHHTKKSHPYASIIKDFYAQEAKHSILPKIFGMTASPVDARVDVKKAAAELETLLHCEIATTADATLQEFTGAGLQEQTAKYASLGPEFETPLLRQMVDKFQTTKILKRPLTFAREATRELGPWCADQIWLFCLADDEVKKLHARTEREYRAEKIAPPLEVLEKHRIQLEEARAIVKGHAFAPPDYKTMFTQESIPLATSNLSSKVILLISILKSRFERPTDDKCIIFVKKRYTARTLAMLFSHPKVGTPHLRVGLLVCVGFAL